MRRRREFYLPHEVKVLHDAVDQAHMIIASTTGVAGADVLTSDLLARGVLRAARTGKLDAARLSMSACLHWVDATIVRRPPMSFRIH